MIHYASPGSGKVLELIGVTHKLLSQQNPGARHSGARHSGAAIPGGMEQLFDELETALQDGSLDDARHRQISQKYGTEWLE